MMTSDQDDQTMVMTSGLRGEQQCPLLEQQISFQGPVQLAQTIKEMLTNNPEAGAASDMSTEDLFGLLGSLNASAARSGNTGALAGHVVGLLGAAIPAALPTPAPAPVSPVVALCHDSSAPMIPMAPIYATAAPVAALPSTSA
ncbi:hypothetical protein GQ600_15085 [Phytophthora cactorum]|nr:hypothetical protein GQ600_15085 [Phytophthora cactorum]